MKPSSIITLGVVAAALSASFLIAQDSEKKEKVHPIGYSDTPKLPHTQWKVHDIDRPRPKVVNPGKSASDAPADAVVLFDGTNLDHWIGDKGKKAAWKIEDGYMEVNGTGNLFTKQKFGDCQLHIEWMSPSPVQSNSQHRGNSGIFLIDQFEVQVLDCFENKTYADGQAGGLYGQYPPLVNAARKPGEWQTYEIIFNAPRYKDNKQARPARVTVIHNGVVTLNNARLLGTTAHKKVAAYKDQATDGPIRLQDHNDNQPVRFRNIWVRPLKGYGKR